MAVRKLNSDGTLAWMAAFLIAPAQKGLAVDSSEQYVYVACDTSPMNVIRMSSSTGTIVDVKKQ